VINPRGTRRRLALSVLAVFAIVAVFLIRLIDIQVVRADDLRKSADERRIATVTTYGARGSIIDANGKVLASSVDRFDITAAPKLVNPLGFTRTETVDGTKVETKVTLPEAVAEISAITGVDPTTLLTALTEDPESPFTYLAKAVKLDVFNQVKALHIPWVYSEPHPSRSYPDGAIAGNLVGFVGTDGPQAGIEKTQGACLDETNGTSRYEMSADGVRMPGSEVVEEQPADGGTVLLTIDSDLNWFAQQVLAEQGTALGADWATAMVVRVSDGQIMAAADWPTVDPNNPGATDAGALGARLFSTPYEPGSIMKPATIASLLDAGKITPATQIVVPGRLTEGLPAGRYIKDSWAHSDLRFTATGVLMNSSNVGVAQLSTRLSVKARHDYLDAFGFGHDTAVDFFGESSGMLKSVEELTGDPITSLTQQFGQGMSATTAQIASLYQAIGNDGVRVPLSLVAGCRWPDGSVTQQPDTTGTRVVSADAAHTTVLMMEPMVSQGPLKNILTIPGYRVAAKTGTAEVAENGRYTSDRVISVAGLVPAENPQYAIVVSFVKPDTMKTSAAAAPAFNAIMKQVIKTFRITPSTEPAPALPLTW
jgi:cell division protein FtsI (penicillin-binding protein 3)